MIHVLTTKHKRRGQKGNCLAAALASVLELAISDVPEFEEMTPQAWKGELHSWADSINVDIVFSKAPTKGYGVGVGKILGETHAVVVHKGEFCFDPNGTDCFYDEHRYYIHVNKRTLEGYQMTGGQQSQHQPLNTI